jgi:FAD:protein FMN transferase
MKDTKILMGMPVTVEIVDKKATQDHLDKIYNYFKYVDQKFSVYKDDSEISQINSGLIGIESLSEDMKEILALCEQTKKDTGGYFNILKNDKLDPSGLVKGWAIKNAAELISSMGFKNFYVNAGGDIQVHGKNKLGKIWTIGIQNPFNLGEVVKALQIESEGVATSGTYIRGQHVYNPYDPTTPLSDVVSLTVIGPDIYEADRFATAAYAMGLEGIDFIESLPGFEGYMIDRTGVATMTKGFEKYIKNE